METDQIQLNELKPASNGSFSEDQTLPPEGEIGEEERHRVTTKQARKLRIAAVAVSWCSVIFSASTGIAALALGTIDKSEALFGYGLDATLDGLSSVAVLWRFYGDLYSEKKERKACFVIGWLFVLSGLLLTGKSLHSIVTKIHEARAIILYTAFALTTGVVSVILGMIKVYVGYKLESVALGTDSIITFVGAAMSFLGVAGLELYVQDTRFWFMDSIFGLICGIFLVVFGIRVIYGVWKLRGKNGHIQLQ